MKNILIISGHPNLQHSLANAEILAEVEKSLPKAEIRKLDALYPNRRFDIAAEQDALLIDEVFVHGFAHGSTAKLGGKKLIVSFTTGAPAALYQKDGFFKHSVEEYLPQFETFAALRGLDYQQPVYTCGIGYTDRGNEEAVNTQKQQAREHAARLVAQIKAAAA